MNRWVVVAAALLLVLTAWNSTGHHQGDEYFQILEFAAYKLGITEVDGLAWEYGERMRPALQPALVYGVYQLVDGVGTADPFLVALLLRLLSAGLTLWVALLLYRRYAAAVPTGFTTGLYRTSTLPLVRLLQRRALFPAKTGRGWRPYSGC